jgi:phosphate transport system permease protein
MRKNETLLKFSLLCCALVSGITTIGIVGVLLFETIEFFKEVSIFEFLTDTQWTPLFTKKHFGIAPLLCGTLLTSGIALILALPLGLLISVYLSEYAPDNIRKFLKPLLEVLAGVPTVVYGYFALLFVTPLLRNFLPNLPGFNALAPGIVLGVMILPLVSSLSEDAMYSIPSSLKAAGYALGATKLQVCFTVVMPAAFPGIIASFILAMSRAIGETMLVTIAAGQMPNLTLNPMEAVQTMTAFIVQISLGDTPTGTIEYKTIFAVGSVLFLLTLILNTISYKIRKQFVRL